MMKGTKRFAASDSNPDSAFRNKRIIAGSSLDVYRAEPSREQSIGTPPLDAQRAASSRRHVRALNTQFASWVQTQLNNHPNELWEDGVRGYLSHASNIMEKFSDVVDWLKANAAKGENLAVPGSCTTTEKKVAPEFTNSETKSFQAKALSSPVGTTSIFATSWSSGVISNSQSSAGVSSNNPSSAGVSSDNQSSSGVFSNQSLPFFSSNQSSGIFSSSQSSGSDQNKTQSSVIFPNSQGSGIFSNSQSSGVSSNSPSFGALSNTANFGLFSNGQSSSSSQSSMAFPSTPSFGLFSNSQSSSNSPSSVAFSNPPSFGFFSNNQSSGLSSNSQPPSLFGVQSSVPAKHDGSEEADAENDLEQPSSPSVKKSEEKGVLVVHEVKCKLYVKSSDPEDKDTWKDKGTGQLSIKCKEGVSKGTKESKPQIIVRNDVGRVQLNALLYSGIKTNLQKNSIVTIFHTAGEGDGNDGNGDSVVARTFLIRLKTEEDRNKLATAIQEYAPAS